MFTILRKDRCTVSTLHFKSACFYADFVPDRTRMFSIKICIGRVVVLLNLHVDSRFQMKIYGEAAAPGSHTTHEEGICEDGTTFGKRRRFLTTLPEGSDFVIFKGNFLRTLK